MLDNNKSVGKCFKPDKHREAGLFLEEKCKARGMTSRGYEPKLDNNKIKDERGYLLIESLLGLILLSIIAMSLITTLPILLDANARLDQEQAIYHRLFELHTREVKGPHVITEPYEFQVFRQHDEWCAAYVWRRDGSERTICL